MNNRTRGGARGRHDDIIDRLRRDAQHIERPASASLQRRVREQIDDLAASSARSGLRARMAPAALLAIALMLLVATIAVLPTSTPPTASDTIAGTTSRFETTETRRRLLAVRDRLETAENPLLREARGMVQDAREAARFVLDRLPSAPSPRADAS